MSAYAMPVRYRMPFNFAQVIIAAFGAAVLCGFVFSSARPLARP